MSLYINTALIGSIVLIMAFTYTAELVFFADASDINHLGKLSSTSVFPIQKKDWINVQWDFAYDKYYNVHTYTTLYGDLKNIKNPDSSQDILDDWQRHTIGTETQSLLFLYPYPDYGYKLYTGSHNQGSKYDMSFITTSKLDSNYLTYCYHMGYTSEGSLIEKNLIDNAISFLGQIPDGVSKFTSFITFDIKKEYQKIDTHGNIIIGETDVIPNSVRIVLNIFFIPMWIIIAIEILPIIAKIIEAIGSLIPL